VCGASGREPCGLVSASLSPRWGWSGWLGEPGLTPGPIVFRASGADGFGRGRRLRGGFQWPDASSQKRIPPGGGTRPSEGESRGQWGCGVIRSATGRGGDKLEIEHEFEGGDPPGEGTRPSEGVSSYQIPVPRFQFPVAATPHLSGIWKLETGNFFGGRMVHRAGLEPATI
jgi:hypothetical protein